MGATQISSPMDLDKRVQKWRGPVGDVVTLTLIGPGDVLGSDHSAFGHFGVAVVTVVFLAQIPASNVI